MKKLLSLLLTFILVLLCLASCADNSGENEDSSTDVSLDTSVETNEDTTDDEDDEFVPTSDKKSLRINYNTAGIHVFGKRVFEDRNYLACDYSGSGIEFVIEAEGGDLTVVTRTSAECRFLVTLDGEVQTYDGKAYATVNGDGNIVVSKLTAGKHTVKIVKLTSYETSRAAFRTLEFYGTFLTKEVPADNEGYIEFLGGSAAAGLCADGSEDATLAYAYDLALRARTEYTIMALADEGLLSDISKAYLCASIERDASTEYDFALTPSLTVIHVGSNGQDAETFAAAYKKLCEAVKENNGKLSKVLCVYSNTDTVALGAVTAVCAELGGEEAGMFSIGVSVKDSGALSAAEQKALADAIAPAMEKALEAEVTAGSVNTETGDPDIKIDNNSPEWYA